MDENQFFREATLRICGSLHLRQAMEQTLEYIQGVVPADCLYIGLYDPDRKVGRTLIHIAPAHWPRFPETLVISDEAQERLLFEWSSKPKFGLLNDIREEDPAFRDLLLMMWPGNASLLHTDLELDSRRIGVLLLAVEGRHQYREEHARLMSLLNEPFSVALANALQHQEVLRLKEMLEDENRYLHTELRNVSGDTIIGADFGLKGVMEMIRQVAPMESPVLLLGETGTGKELLANAVHAASTRRDGPFIKVNCGGLPESLLDSELFGHEKGAFTGASARKRGRFERAHGGTIFLDEIGELGQAAQVKLLRVLQHREIERVGGTETIPVDVRIISATHRNLEEMVRQGTFREDLWFRLNVFPIMIPPLRQRPQDLPALVDHLIRKKTKEIKITRPVRLAPRSLEVLRRHPWPGNVRELQNLVERSLIQAQANPLGDLVLDPDPGGTPSSAAQPGRARDTEIPPLDEAVARHIIRALEKTGGRVMGPRGAAELLGVNPSTLRGKMRRLRLLQEARQIRGRP
ncbi:MAG: sigma 54-interacting transcriptional regulator [Pseudomonadota bacterium]